VTRIVTLQLEGFVRSSLDRLTRRAEDSPQLGVRTAILYYLGNREEGPPGWHAPRFRVGSKNVRGEGVAVDDETWAALEAEAGRQGVTPGRLAEHAVLFYLADLESGRIAERLGAALQEPDDED
jgi:hypothetical protein